MSAHTTKFDGQDPEELANLINKPPSGRQPILARVYEHYAEEEDIDNYDYLDEQGNVRRHTVHGGIEDSDEEALQYLYSKKTRKERIAEATAKYEEFRKKEEEERLIEAEIQKDEDLKFPTKMGWFYTDGYYDWYPPVGINPELVEDCKKKEKEFREKLAKQRGETFTEKFKRHFWPPKIIRGTGQFRTRGSYLDYKEILANPIPPIEVDLEHPGVEILSNSEVLFHPEEDVVAVGDDFELESGQGTEAQEAVMTIMGEKGPIQVVGGKVGWEDFYYDDEAGEFQRKVPGLEIDYYFDGQNTCWRRKRKKRGADDQTAPYDYYWDRGSFYPRSGYQGKHTLDISYDPVLAIWKFNPKESTHAQIQRGEIPGTLPPRKVIVETEIQQKKKGPGSPEAETSPENKKDESELKPSDYYFDENDTEWKKKPDPEKEKESKEGKEEIEYDENGKRWTKKFEGGNWRGLTGYSPDDFYWADDIGKFQLKVKHQPKLYTYMPLEGIWRPVQAPKKKNKMNHSPTDYYFDDGMFKLKDAARDHLYQKLRYALIYKLKEEPKSGLYPEDYYYDHNKKMWLPRSVRMAVLKTKEEDLPFNQKTMVDKNNPVPKQDDYWFDIEEGIFVKKDKGSDIYYFDEDDKVWKNNKQKVISKLRILPGDYFFNGSDFKRKSKDEPETSYEFDLDSGVYWSKDQKKRNAGPNKFYYDYATEAWKSKSSDAGLFQDAAGRFVKKDPAQASPHDYFWDDSVGRVFKKEVDKEEQYYFAPEDGIFKLRGPVPNSNPSGLTPRNFYYDEEENRWRLKVAGHDRDYYWDKNNHFFRHVINLDTKNGLKPSDYYFNTFLGQWMVVGNYDKKKLRQKQEAKKKDWAPTERGYDKPWLKSTPTTKTIRPPVTQKPGLVPEKDKTPADQPEQSTKLKMTNFDPSATKEEDIKELFPNATKIELKTDEGIALISFANAEQANNERQARDGVVLKGKKIILESIIEDS